MNMHSGFSSTANFAGAFFPEVWAAAGLLAGALWAGGFLAGNLSAGGFFAGAFSASAFFVGVVFVETSFVREFCCTTCFVAVALVVAVAPACFNARTSLFSSQISTPRDSAFATLLPGLSPTTSTFAVLLTSPVMRPPAAVIAASASLRDIDDNVPVTTNTRSVNTDLAITHHLSHRSRKNIETRRRSPSVGSPESSSNDHARQDQRKLGARQSVIPHDCRGRVCATSMAERDS